MKKDSKHGKVMSTGDMLTHPWLLSEHDTHGGPIVKKKTQFKADPHSSHSSGMNVKLSLKELLNISSDWKEENQKNPTGGPSYLGDLPKDF